MKAFSDVTKKKRFLSTAAIFKDGKWVPVGINGACGGCVNWSGGLGICQCTDGPYKKEK